MAEYFSGTCGALLASLCLSLPARAQGSVFHDDFSSNTLDNYRVIRHVQWNPADSTLLLTGPGNSELYTLRAFGNNLDLRARLFVRGQGKGKYDNVSLALFDKDHNNKYWATLAYGSELAERNHIGLRFNGQWEALVSFALQPETWYLVRVQTTSTREQHRIRMKVWQQGDDEPADWQVSRELAFDFKASGGVGFRHFGLGTRVDDLSVQADSLLRLEAREMLPRPILRQHPAWEALYWKAWDIALTKVQYGNQNNGFVESYIDEGFNPNIFQWDTCFMMLFARYAYKYLPTIVSLDNFYRKQHSDGAICREIRESDGSDFWPKSALHFTNPPLYAWAEWQYFLMTNDRSRLARVLPILDRYFHWCKQNRTRANGLYYWSNLASGMDNSPRPESRVDGWVDYTSQQALAAFYLAKMAELTGDSALAQSYRREHETLKTLANQLLWNEADGYYWDFNSTSNQQIKTRTAGCFWPLLAHLAGPGQAEKLVQHLTNPQEFHRRNLFPTLSADHPAYRSDGGYWQGSVWAPTNVMYIKGLQHMGYENLATEAAENYVDMMSRVFQNVEPHSIWENYAPESDAPGNPAKAEFVGWSGCGPIALLIENIIGLRVNAPDNQITWHLNRTEAHGIENLYFADNRVNLLCAGRTSPADSGHITVTAEKPFTLQVIWQDSTWVYDLPAGTREITVPGSQVISVKQTPGQLPATFRLLQNFPNPFYRATTVRIDMPRAGILTIQVYDLLGKQVLQMSQRHQKGGVYNIHLNLARLPAGLYFLQVNFQNQIFRRKILHLQ